MVDVKPAVMRPAPELGEHDELLERVVEPAPAAPHAETIAHRPEYTMKPVSSSQPLAGLTIVEVGTGLAVGTAGMLLADFGAGVTKVLPPWGESSVAPDGPAGEVVEEQLHENKAVERLHLGTGDGRRRLDDLVRQASAIIVSGPMRFRRVFGLEESAIRAVQTDIVYCGLTGYGPSGPLADAPATEFDVQLLSGMTRQLGRVGDPPVRQGFHLASVNTGYTQRPRP